MSNPNLWSHDTFAGYFKSSPRKAFEYRRDTLGDAIPDEWLTPEEKDAIANGTTLPESTPADTEIVKDPGKKEEGYTEADLKEILKKNNIKFFGGAKLEALAELCIKNNLL